MFRAEKVHDDIIGIMRVAEGVECLDKPRLFAGSIGGCTVVNHLNSVAEGKRIFVRQNLQLGVVDLSAFELDGFFVARGKNFHALRTKPRARQNFKHERFTVNRRVSQEAVQFFIGREVEHVTQIHGRNDLCAAKQADLPIHLAEKNFFDFQSCHLQKNF